MWSADCDVVYCGFWIDLSKGTIQGSTLTLPSNQGLIIVAFLALFVKLVGGHLWGIICFAIHQICATSGKQDDIYHQLQVTLRNTKSELDLISNVIKIGHSHKGTRFEAYRRSTPLLALAILHALAFYAAGIFSSQVIAGNYEVLIINKSCGWMKDVLELLNSTDPAAFESANSLLVMARNAYQKSASYSRACYVQNGGRSAGCSTYVRSTIPYNINLSVPCPFDERICKGSGVAFDTGLIRSDLDLGINTRPEDSLTIRKVLTCAPLAGEKYTDGWHSMQEGYPSVDSFPPGTLWKGWRFGRKLSDDPLLEYTFFANEAFHKTGDRPYHIDWMTRLLNDRDVVSDFEPILELQSQDSDVTVIGLMSRVVYPIVIDDPWYNAQNCTNQIQASPMPVICSATNLFSFLGCKERYQLCTKDKAQCSAFTGLHNIGIDQEQFQDLNSAQKIVFKILWESINYLQLKYQLALIGHENLVANEYRWTDGAFTGISARLPSNLWQTEVANWMNTTLATMQQLALSYARPPESDVGPSVSSLEHIIAPETEEEKSFCDKMKARSKEHNSFPIFRILLIITVGLLIIVTNLALAKITARVQTWTNKCLYKRLEWIETSVFQLQRMAAEGRGIGPWTRREEDVPRLVEYGRRFTLTGKSLEGRWSQSDSYKMMSGEWNEESEHEMVRIKILNLRESSTVRDDSEPLIVRR